MGFIEHLEELRKRIIRSFASVVVGFVSLRVARRDLRLDPEADHDVLSHTR